VLIVPIAQRVQIDRRAGPIAIASAVSFAIVPLWQLHQNAIHLGGYFASGYAFWVPEIYGSFGNALNARFVFGPTLPRNPHGNLLVYLLALCGLDWIVGGPGSPYFYLYPFPAAAFAAIGISRIRSFEPNVRRIAWFGLMLLAGFFTIHLFHIFTDVVFLLPASFVLYMLAGYGAAFANRRLAELFRQSTRGTRENLIVVGTLLMDVLLVVLLASQLERFLERSSPQSTVVPAIRAAERLIENDSTVVSNISLQFLALYMKSGSRRFEGLHSFDPGEDFSDYHLSRLYAKRAMGWAGPIPPALFDGDKPDSPTMSDLIATARKDSAYLMLAAPQTPDYASRLTDELRQLEASFTLEPVFRLDELSLYRLRVR
jgi:hypothetical protein